MDLTGKQKAEQQFRDELRILGTQIESINQQLAGGVGGGGPAAQKAMMDVSQKLQFLYEFLKTMQTDIRADQKASMQQVQSTLVSTLQKNLGDMYGVQQETLKTIKAQGSGGIGQADIDDMKKTLKALIGVYQEEVQIFRQQNEFLQKKLVDIEQRLGDLEK